MFNFLKDKYWKCVEEFYDSFVSDRDRASKRCENKKIKKDFKNLCKICGGKLKNLLVARLPDKDEEAKKMQTCV